jgi:EAL domain-containing protein (putative c-di-GMP-specific phosphodiesterase class I)/ActR/RegA family two-component response regulator
MNPDLPVSTDDSVFVNATVLVVDDHPPNLALFERILSQAGVPRVHITMDPLSVIDLYTSLQPDLVLLDLHMPGMDGIAVMDAIRRATPEDEFVPVIVLTADATSETRDRVLAAGASDFLTKPVDRAEVVLRARNLLRTRTLHRRVWAHNADLRAEIAARNAADELATTQRLDKRQRVLNALESDAPRMVFQPIVELDSRQIVGYEALARFDQEPAQTPDVWFADAADVGLGTELELGAVRAALRLLPSLPADAFLTLNASPTTVMTAELTEVLAGHPQERLVVEITEHAQVKDYDQLLGALSRLREAGVRLAVDDAGAGFASLHHILRLRPDIIKLDITLVRDIDRDPIKRALASSLVTFACDIGSTITAEGIETPDELATLVDLRVPWGQGYHLGRPAQLADQTRTEPLVDQSHLM